MLFVSLVILCFYVLSMWFLSTKCVLGLFVCFDVFLGLMILGKGLELVKTSWKTKRLIFGRFRTIMSHYTWDDSLQKASIPSQHPGTTRHRDKRPRRFWIEQFLYFSHNFLYRHPNEVIQVALERWLKDLELLWRNFLEIKSFDRQKYPRSYCIVQEL